MSGGAVLDEAYKAASKATGTMVTMLVKKQINRHSVEYSIEHLLTAVKKLQELVTK